MAQIRIAYSYPAEESPQKRKPQLGDQIMKTLGPVIASNGVPYLKIVSRIAQHIRQEERKVQKCLR